MPYKAKGVYSDERRKQLSLAHIGIQRAEKHAQWMGDKVGISGIHRWIRKWFGNPQICENCDEVGQKKNGRWTIQLALIKGLKYERKRENFMGLCAKCHIEYDGTSVGNRLGGIKFRFKKGMTPWNKGLNVETTS